MTYWLRRTGIPMVLTIVAAILLATAVANADPVIIDGSGLVHWRTSAGSWIETHVLDLFWWLR